MQKKRRPGSKDWSVVATVLIAGGTLAWAIAAHFIPPAESASKPEQRPASTVNAIASGPGSVGYVNGGTVTITVPAQEPLNSRAPQPQP